MGFEVSPFQALRADVRVDLGTPNADMAQQLLHNAQIHPVVQQVGGKTVSKHVRMNGFVQFGHGAQLNQ